MNAATTWPHGDPRTVAHSILAGKQYRDALAPLPPKSLWDSLVESFFKWFESITRGHALGNPTLTTILGFAVLALALILMAAVVVRLVRPALQRRVAQDALHADALAVSGDARRLRERALAAAAAGRYREAAALLWASALHALDERGRVRYDAARTPGEWRRAVRDPNFDRLARDAVVALFGDRAVDAAFFTRMRSSYDAVLGA